jgi:hypothetical protein
MSIGLDIGTPKLTSGISGPAAIDRCWSGQTGDKVRCTSLWTWGAFSAEIATKELPKVLAFLLAGWARPANGQRAGGLNNRQWPRAASIFQDTGTPCMSTSWTCADVVLWTLVRGRLDFLGRAHDVATFARAQRS